MASHLNFLIIDLNGANKMDFEDLKRPTVPHSFHVTEEMLDNCDIDESVTFESISVSKPIESSAKRVEVFTEPVIQNGSAQLAKDEIETNIREEKHVEVVEAQNPNSLPKERCEDEIFGEFVVSMLKKMPTDDKRRAKKEIMNILI